MKAWVLIFCGIVLFSSSLLAQDGSIWVKGKVIDGVTGKPVVSAQVFNHYGEKGIYSNLKGEFNILVDHDHLLRFRALGYDAKSISFISLDEKTKNLIVALTPHSFYIEDITVLGTSPNSNQALSFPWLKKENYSFSVYDGAPVIIDSDLRLMNKKERALRKYKDEFELVK